MNVKAYEELERISCRNHEEVLILSNDKREATIKLKNTADNMSAPCRDFVLYFNHKMVNKPLGLLKVLEDGS